MKSILQISVKLQYALAFNYFVPISRRCEITYLCYSVHSLNLILTSNVFCFYKVYKFIRICIKVVAKDVTRFR